MKVTPRLPIHGLYTDSDYVEMRYFRFGGFSLPVALLFSLAENSLFPHLSSLKDNIQAKTSQCGQQGKKLLSMSTDKSTPANCILAAWNSDNSAIPEAMHAFGFHSMAADAMARTVKDAFQLQLVKYGSEGMGRADMDAIFWDESNAGAIVLLYREYGLESFAVLDCGHIYYKAAMYRKARAAMQRPRIEAEMSGVKVICGVEQCRANICNSAFSIGKLEAAITSHTGTSLATIANSGSFQRNNYELGQCTRCAAIHQRNWICRYDCHVCLHCAAAMSLTKHGLCCFQCGHRYRAEVLEDLIEIRRKQIGGVKEIAVTTRCRQCKSSKPITDFTVLKLSKHKCWLCDICLLTMKVDYYAAKACLYCEDELSSEDQQAIFKWQQENQYRDALDGSRTSGAITRVCTGLCCALCSEIKSDVYYTMKTSYQHSCNICDACFKAKVKPLGKCLLCLQPILLELWGIRETACCLACSLLKPPVEFQISFFLTHPCLLCNRCVLSSIRACKRCCLPFSDKDTCAISANAQSDPISEKRCPCRNLISAGRFSCPTKCFCSPCHLAHILLSKTRSCWVCSGVCSGDIPHKIQCSNCLREIFSTGAGSLFVSGICAKGHICCQYCLKVDGDHFSCPLCKSSILGKPTAELMNTQKKLRLACYCEEFGSKEMVNLPCEHVAHVLCSNLLYNCRICGYNLRARHKEVTIWEYAK